MNNFNTNNSSSKYYTFDDQFNVLDSSRRGRLDEFIFKENNINLLQNIFT